jgi:glutamine amidotransferase
MCPWLAWHGQPVLIEELLFNTALGSANSLRPRGVRDSTSDGFGIGWYAGGRADVFRSVAPSLDDPEIRALAARIESPLFMAHARLGPGQRVRETDCHPFSHGDWLFVHSGSTAGFDEFRDELVALIGPSRAAEIHGSTDSEVLFHLALAMGLDDDPVAALEGAVGAFEEVGRRNGVEHPVHATIGLSNGAGLWVVRYSTWGSSPSVFVSADVQAARMLYPGNARLQRLRDDDHIVAFRPFADMPGAWDELTEGTMLVIAGGRAERRMFRPTVSGTTGTAPA